MKGFIPSSSNFKALNVFRSVISMRLVHQTYAHKATQNITNEMSYTLVDMLTWQGLGDIINAWRKDTLGLMQLHQAAAVSALNRLRIPFTYCW